MHFRARHAQVVCGSEEAARMGLLRDLKIDDEVEPSGTAVEPGTLLLTLSGRAADLHRVWKPAQTLMEYAGGVNAGNAQAYAATGAQILVSSAPYQGAPRDVAVTVEATSG